MLADRPHNIDATMENEACSRYYQIMTLSVFLSPIISALPVLYICNSCTFIYVFGQCSNRTYGPQCTKKCGFCKNDSPCDEVTGMCQGCSAGYEGLLCLSRCSQGLYGEDCLQRCTLCVNNDCDPMNGTCTNGTVSTTEGTQPATIISTGTTQSTTTTTQQRGLVFDSPAVLFGLSIPMLALIGAGALIFLLIIALISHTLLNKCCPRKKQVEPTYNATRRRSTRSMSFVYKKWSSKPT